jgi:hypothetical protein
MNKVDPKRRILFVAVFTILAVLIARAWDHWRQLPTQQQRPALLGTEGQEAANVAQEQRIRSTEEQASAEHAKYLARYLNTGSSRKPGMKMVAIAVVSENGTFNHAVNAAIANRFKTDSVEVLTSFFRPPFVTDGLFANALAGSNEIFDKLELSKSLDVLLLGREEVQYSTDPSLENVMSANMQLEVTAISMADGHRQSWTFVANGAGFKQSEARLMAEERLLKQIAGDTKMSLSF